MIEFLLRVLLSLAFGALGGFIYYRLIHKHHAP